MKAVILDGDTLGRDIDLTPIRSLVDELSLWPLTSPSEVMTRLEGASIAVTNKVVIDDAIMASLPELKMIAVTATGTNNIDLKSAERRGIQIANVKGYGTESVAQHTLMLMLSLAGRLPLYQKDLKAGRWEKAPFFCLLDYPLLQLAGKKLVIVGRGELGRAVATLAEAFGMKVYFSARPGSDGDDARAPLAELLPQADVVSLHCPLTEDTHHLIDRAALSQMKSGALLINCGRGSLIDESAALEALEARHLGGLGVDVLPIEPPRDGHPLLDALSNASLNLIVTPHNAWASLEARQRVVDMTADNVRRFLDSQRR